VRTAVRVVRVTRDHGIEVADGNDTTAKLLYEETVRGLSNDLSIVESLRARAGTLFGAALIATSFLSAKDDETLTPAAWGTAAIVLFGLAALVTALMVMPRTMGFALDRLDVSASAPAGKSPYAFLTERFRKVQEANKRPKGYMFWGMKFLPLIVASELLCWVNELSNLDWKYEVVPIVVLNVVGLGFALWGQIRRLLSFTLRRSPPETSGP
jgi:hypothetical protein